MSFEKPLEENFQGLNLKELDIDQAYVSISVPDSDKKLFLYTLSENCIKCPYKLYSDSQLNETVLKLVTHHPWSFRLRNSSQPELVSTSSSDFICETTQAHLGQFGVYDLIAPDDPADRNCRFETALEPVNSNLAILYCSLILIGLGVVYNVFNILIEKGYFNVLRHWVRIVKRLLGYEVKEKTEDDTKIDVVVTAKPRLRSLDTFRGITIALMIFVNDGAGGYWFMEHATWNGLQVADLAFPWFMWIMGFCVPMSVRSLNKRKTPTGVALIGILRRSIVLFLLGFMWNTNGWIVLERLRVPGVLQRFSITYFVVASTAFVFSKRDEKNDDSGCLSYIKDLCVIWQRWAVCAVFLVAHCLLVFLLPVPDCPTGYLGPGGLADDNSYPGECIGGATGYIDRLFFGTNHIYGNPTAKSVYQSAAFDPEGILGSFTSIVQVFIGYQGGQIILSYSEHKERVVRFFIWAVLTSGIGLLLCGASQDDGWIPINKNLWSLSYVMVTSGLAFFLMAAVYILVDVKQWWFGEPFLAAGMNSILLYLGHQTAYQMLPFNFSDGEMKTHWIRLVESLWGVCAWLIVAYVLYRKKVFVTV